MSRREKTGRCLLIPNGFGRLSIDGSMLLLLEEAFFANSAIFSCKEGGIGVDTGC